MQGRDTDLDLAVDVGVGLVAALAAGHQLLAVEAHVLVGEHVGVLTGAVAGGTYIDPTHFLAAAAYTISKLTDILKTGGALASTLTEGAVTHVGVAAVAETEAVGVQVVTVLTSDALSRGAGSTAFHHVAGHTVPILLSEALLTLVTVVI